MARLKNHNRPEPHVGSVKTGFLHFAIPAVRPNIVRMEHAQNGYWLASEYTRAERIADGVIHVVGLSASLVAASVLIILTALEGDAARIGSAAAYGLAMVAVFALSASYNMWPGRGFAKEVLRRCDHAAIYVKIAGTYTPFAAVSLAGAAGGVGRILLVGVWLAAVAGAALKLGGPRRR